MAALGVAAPSLACLVLVCQSCPYVWEPATVAADEFAALVRQGCPDCGGWVWLGEVVGPTERSGFVR